MHELRELITAERIEKRVEELARQISSDYSKEEKVILVGVLNGCFVFLSDLVRRLTFNPTIDFLRVTSYGAATETSGVVEIRKDVEATVLDQPVLIVEDIVDTGLTLNFLRRHLEAAQPRSLRVCTLLDKKCRRRVECSPDYVGFEIGDEFVVGYGLDYDGRYRNLPSICALDL